MYGLKESNAVLKDTLVNKISPHMEVERPFSVPNGGASRPLLATRSLRSDTEMQTLDMEIKHLENSEKELLQKLATIKNRNTMSEPEYSRRRDEINRLLEKDDKETRDIIKERDQALKDLRNVESAYSDVHEKYNRVMGTLESLKEKESLLVERDHENMVKIKDMDAGLEKFKQDAYKHVEAEYHNWLSKLAEAEGTNLKYKAMIRKAEMKIEKLEHELSQKEKENNELHNLCDELIHNAARKGD